MTTVQELIHKLQVMAQDNSNEPIHIDTMLGITQRLYEELYSAKYLWNPKSFEANGSVTSNTAAVVANSSAMQLLQQDSVPTADVDINDEMEALFNNGNTANDHLFDEETSTEPEVPSSATATTPKTEANLGISFEFPSQQVIQKVVRQEESTASALPPIPSLATDASAELIAESTVTEKVDLLSEEQAAGGKGQGFKSPTVPNQKDFRSYIGFNDKYLFLNELFNNNKELLDATIAKINNTNSRNEAIDWIDEELSTNLKWSKEDTTVTTFYALVDKYFTTI